METFSALLAIVRGIHRSPVNSPTKASDAELYIFFDVRMNLSDLRGHNARYDVTVMVL